MCAEGSSLQPLLDAALDAGAIEPQQSVDLLLGTLFDEAIRQAEVEHRLALFAAHQQLVHRRTRAAHDGVVFEGDELIVGRG